MFKGLQKSQRKNITSSLYSRQKPEGINQQYSVIRDDAEHSNSEMNQLVHASQNANDKYTLKSSKARKGKEEVKFKHPGSTNDDDIECDVIKHDNDATIRDTDVNKLIARKRYAPRKQSLVHSKGSLKSLLRVCRQTFTFIAFIYAIVISILGGLCNIKLPERKSPIGTSPTEEKNATTCTKMRIKTLQKFKSIYYPISVHKGGGENRPPLSLHHVLS